MGSLRERFMTRSRLALRRILQALVSMP